MSKPILWIDIPCYNEEQVLPITAPMFLKKINGLAAAGLISEKSRVLFVNDGSRDATFASAGGSQNTSGRWQILWRWRQADVFSSTSG